MPRKSLFAIVFLMISMNSVQSQSNESHLLLKHEKTSAPMTAAEFQSLPSKAADAHYAYGKDPQQFGQLRLPPGSGPHPVVIFIHGGCWKSEYSTLHEMGPMADALKDFGIASWNVEYRRLGNPGGGWPGTYQDAGAAVDFLRSIASQNALDLKRVIIVGHSAGGHLAMWVAARHRIPPTSLLYSTDPLPLLGVINLAGTADMESFIPAEQQGCKDHVVEKMMGGAPADVPANYTQTSSLRMVPLGLPQVTFWGTADVIAPISLGKAYTAAARRAGDPARMVTFKNVGHFEIASPMSPTWLRLSREIRHMLGR